MVQIPFLEEESFKLNLLSDVKNLKKMNEVFSSGANPWCVINVEQIQIVESFLVKRLKGNNSLPGKGFCVDRL